MTLIDDALLLAQIGVSAGVGEHPACRLQEGLHNARWPHPAARPQERGPAWNPLSFRVILRGLRAKLLSQAEAAYVIALA
jgi:hypothetical protein